MFNRRTALSVLSGGLLATAAASVVFAAAPLRGEIKIAGSSTVGPITQAIMEEFYKEQPEVRVSNSITGTGGGFKKFTVGETDISNASRPIKGSEAEAATSNGIEFIELPVAYDGLTIVVNHDNTWCDDLTVDELKRIFLSDSKVKNWSDIRAGWPSIPVKMYIPGTDSGTFDYFKEVIAEKDGAIRSDVTVSEDDNVLVRGVAGEKGGIGFFGCAYYFENIDKVKAVAIDEGHGAVMPTTTTIENGTYAPFSRPLFVYVNKRSAARPEVKAFVEYYLEHAGDMAEEVGYVRLPKDIYNKARRNFMKGKTGSCYLDASGKSLHGSITELYQ